MRRTSVLVPLARAGAGIAAAAAALTSTKPAHPEPTRPPRPLVSVGKVGDFMVGYRSAPAGFGGRPSHTYRWARRAAAKLRRKGRLG